MAYPANRTDVADHFPDASVRKTVEVDLALLERYDATALNDARTALSTHRLRFVRRFAFGRPDGRDLSH